LDVIIGEQIHENEIGKIWYMFMLYDIASAYKSLVEKPERKAVLET
jgi:hypothetical protein